MVRAGALVLAAGVCGCQKLDEPRARREPLPAESPRFTDAIPLEYGDLVGVTLNPDSPSWAGLWFQGSDRAITVVWVNTTEARIYDQVTSIPRR